MTFVIQQIKIFIAAITILIFFPHSGFSEAALYPFKKGRQVVDGQTVQFKWDKQDHLLHFFIYREIQASERLFTFEELIWFNEL